MRAFFALAAVAFLSSMLVALEFSTGANAAAPAPPVAPGDALFKQRCSMCHSVSGKGGTLGPDLTGIVGRKAGSTSYAYSPALKASKMVWSPITLEQYLASPTKSVPGTRMAVSVSKPEDRKAIIDYLSAVN